MTVLAAIYLLVLWRQRQSAGTLLPRWLLAALAASAPLGFIALEAGWVVTEAGRQPWVIYRVMRTADAVTAVHSVAGSLVVFSALYTALLLIVILFLRRVARAGTGTHDMAAHDMPPHDIPAHGGRTHDTPAPTR